MEESIRTNSTGRFRDLKSYPDSSKESTSVLTTFGSAATRYSAHKEKHALLKYLQFLFRWRFGETLASNLFCGYSNWNKK